MTDDSAPVLEYAQPRPARHDERFTLGLCLGFIAAPGTSWVYGGVRMLVARIHGHDPYITLTLCVAIGGIAVITLTRLRRNAARFGPLWTGVIAMVCATWIALAGLHVLRFVAHYT